VDSTNKNGLDWQEIAGFSALSVVTVHVQHCCDERIGLMTEKIPSRTADAIAYVDANKARFIEELTEFLRFPSISSQSTHENDVIECAQWLRHHLENIGLEARLIKSGGHPIVEATGASRASSPQSEGPGQAAQKLIIYGHYDVQPADSSEEWDSPPFAPAVRNGFIFGRGTTDDKGQLFAHVKAVESLMRTRGELPCDLRFLIEGEEESGGTSLQRYIEAEKTNLAADAVVISDTAMYDERTPAITYGLRGLVGMEVTVRVASRDLHSGAFGGVIGNPGAALAHVIAACIAPDGKVTIPGFYDQIRPLEEWESQNVRRLEFDESGLLSDAGSRAGFGERDFSALERIWARPTFDVNGLLGGYAGKGMKTIIPSSATAKISMRLVPDQEPDRIFNLAAQHIKTSCPAFASVEIKGPFSATEAALFDVNDPAIQVAKEALAFAFAAEPVFIRCGGSIPVANTFWQELRKPVILMGFGLDSDGAHSSNEHFKIESFINGAKTSAYFIEAFGRQD
jgi:acetylornithine deacetylase/succinyl-diaminopimelate desuccinylase-like protein